MLKNTRLMVIWIILVSAIWLLRETTPVQAASGDEPFEGMPLCLPNVYMNGASDCLPLGPSAFLTDLAKKGISYPFQPLPAYPVPNELGSAPFAYMSVGDNGFPLYTSLDDAIARSPAQYMDPGNKWLSIYERIDRDDGVYYRLTNGLWVEGGEANTSCCVRWARTQGRFFYQTPKNDFGWIVDQANVRTAPGYSAAETGKKLPRETIVQIYDMTQMDGTKWYMIGWNEWVERRQIRRFEINTIPPEGVDNGRWIEVNLYEQTLGIYENNQLIFATLIASGIDPFFTRPGLFQVYEKLEETDMSGAFEADRSDYYYLQNVPWTLYYDEARALHGAYWRTLFGYPQSHGCVNLSIGDAQVVYDWANVGDWVYVWDPSGETPTDDSEYTAGGA